MQSVDFRLQIIKWLSDALPTSTTSCTNNEQCSWCNATTLEFVQCRYLHYFHTILNLIILSITDIKQSLVINTSVLWLTLFYPDIKKKRIILKIFMHTINIYYTAYHFYIFPFDDIRLDTLRTILIPQLRHRYSLLHFEKYCFVTVL